MCYMEMLVQPFCSSLQLSLDFGERTGSFRSQQTNKCARPVPSPRCQPAGYYHARPAPGLASDQHISGAHLSACVSSGGEAQDVAATGSERAEGRGRLLSAPG